jgi:hypothetical protein
MNKNMKKIIIVVVLVLVVGTGAFYGGMMYGKNSAQSSRQQFFQANVGGTFQRQVGARGSGLGFVSGEVISKDDQSLTLKMQDNSSKIVFFSDSTSVLKTDQGSIDDIEPGQQIMVQGEENSDGSYTAQSIQQRENLPIINAGQ